LLKKEEEIPIKNRVTYQNRKLVRGT